jgi:hypothetical protein
MPSEEQLDEWVDFFINKFKPNYPENRADKPAGDSQADAKANSDCTENPNQAFFGHLESVCDAKCGEESNSLSSLIKRLVLFVVSSGKKQKQVNDVSP